MPGLVIGGSGHYVGEGWVGSGEAAGASETPTPGGATVGGNAPAAAATAAAGGALAAGTSPSAAAPAGTGGATAAGHAASAQVAVTPGGATTGGVAPAAPEFATPTPGGATAGGTGPAAAVSSTTGGAAAGGASPAAGASVAAGGATAAGAAPAAQMSVSAGGADAQGLAPAAASVSVSAGGAHAAGLAPIPHVSVSAGGATVIGSGPSVRVDVSAGGAIVGGNPPSEPATAIVTARFDAPAPAAGAGSAPSSAAFDPPKPVARLMLTWFTGNRNPSLTDTIKVAGGAYDLTGSTVKLMMRSEISGTLKVDAAATPVNPPGVDGQVRYDWSAADVDTAGDYVAWWRVTKGGKDQDTGEFQIRLLEHGHTAAWLCALADVLEELEYTGQSAAEGQRQSPRLLTLIAEASVQICSEYDREFAPPVAAATRRFEVELDSGYTDLAPYDLRTATTVTLHPEGSSPSVLTAGVDYMLASQLRRYGVYGALQLSRRTSLGSETARRFGYALVDVAGDWGFATVPDPARRACRVAVASWVRRDIPALNVEELNEIGPASTNQIARPTLALPAASHRLLRQFQRY